MASAGIPFDVLISGLDEKPWSAEKPASYALRNATDKAREVAGRPDAAGRPVLAADTIVVLGDRILEKPVDDADARRMLSELSGRRHEVMTGICLIVPRLGGWRIAGDVVITGVHFRALSDAEISSYVATGEPMDKAGAAGFVDSVEGSYTNVVGLPMDELKGLLTRLGLLIPRAP